MVQGPSRIPELVSAPGAVAIALSVAVAVPIPMPVSGTSTSSDSDSDSEEDTRGFAKKVKAAIRAARKVAYKRSTSGPEARKRFSPARFVPRVQATSEYVIPQQEPEPMQMQSVCGGELPALLSIGEAQKRRDIALRSMDLL